MCCASIRITNRRERGLYSPFDALQWELSWHKKSSSHSSNLQQPGHCPGNRQLSRGKKWSQGKQLCLLSLWQGQQKDTSRFMLPSATDWYELAAWWPLLPLSPLQEWRMHSWYPIKFTAGLQAGSWWPLRLVWASGLDLSERLLQVQKTSHPIQCFPTTAVIDKADITSRPGSLRATPSTGHVFGLLLKQP